jgi:hypothetical protein
MKKLLLAFLAIIVANDLIFSQCSYVNYESAKRIKVSLCKKDNARYLMKLLPYGKRDLFSENLFYFSGNILNESIRVWPDEDSLDYLKINNEFYNNGFQYMVFLDSCQICDSIISGFVLIGKFENSELEVVRASNNGLSQGRAFKFSYSIPENHMELTRITFCSY